MKIGFDLDKVFVDYPPLIPDRIIDTLYKKRANGILLYRIPSHPEQLVRKLSHHRLLRPPIQENIDFLRNLPKNKHKLYLISSRFGFLEKQTLALIVRLGLDKIFDGMYFNFENKQPHIFKNEVLKKLHLHIYVDDDIHLLKFVSKENTTTKFYWLSKNISSDIPDSITPVTNLSAIMK